jgi:hypothetical protein
VPEKRVGAEKEKIEKVEKVEKEDGSRTVLELLVVVEKE